VHVEEPHYHVWDMRDGRAVRFRLFLSRDEAFPLTVSGPLGMVSELGSPAASVWLLPPVPLMIWGVLPPVSSGAPDR
jgi:hypothetical protein